MTASEVATWHVLTAWRDDVDFEYRCRSCSVPIRVGDTYRVAGIYLLCTLRPFCPTPSAPVIAKDRPLPRRPQERVRVRRRRIVGIGRPRRVRTSRLPLVTCVCGRQFRRRSWRGQHRKFCSWRCAFPISQRPCAICNAAFTVRSEHPKQETCSPSCGARLREQRKRLGRVAA